MKRINLAIAALFFLLTSAYLYLLKEGLIILPLDLLVSNYGPWYMAGQILVKNSYMQDAILQYYPWHHLVFETLKQGIIPFWNPYQIMGMPFMAGMKPMSFYPLNILFIFGEVEQWHASIFLQIFLGMSFVYALCRDFKLGRAASILSSISFSLCSLMIGFLEFVSDSHAILWLPLFILFSKRFLDKKSGWNLFFLGISIAFSIFAGQLQYSAYGLILLASFVLYYGRLQKAKLRSYILLSTSIFLGILASSLQLLPAFELFSNSYRGLGNSHNVFSSDLINPNQLFRLFSPDFFGNPTEKNLTSGYIETSGYFGIIPFFFALYAAFFAGKNRIVRFFTIFFIAGALFSIKGIAEIIYFFKIPLITSGSGDRIFVLTFLSGSILAGFGLEEFLKGKAKKNIVSLLIFGLLFAFGILLNFKRELFFHDVQFSIEILTIFAGLSFIYLFLKHWEPTKFLRALAVLTFVPWKSITAQLSTRKFSWATCAQTFFVLFIIVLTFFDLFRFGYRYLTFSNKKFMYPTTPSTKFAIENSKETLARSIGLTEPEIGTYMKLYSLETYNPLYIKRSGQLLQALQKLPTNGLPVNKYYLDHRNDNLKYALDFVGVSYVAVPKANNPSIFYFNSTNFAASFDKAVSDLALDLYINKDALPRFGLFYQYKVASSTEELRIISQRNFDVKKELLLEEKLPTELTAGTGSAKLISSNVNSQKFKVETDKPALFYISDTYFSGWTAKVNNNESKIYRANYNFRAVLVPQGSSTIEFSYLPSHFILYAALSIISLGLLAILGFISRKFS